jgi:two-component system, OmpR family, sensor kinase
MTVRQKISFLITAAGFGASLIFSCFIVREMREQPFRIMDSELEATAARAGQIVLEKNVPETPLFIGDKHYWLKVINPEMVAPIYTSELAKQIDIPEPEPGSSATFSLIIPPKKIEIGRGLKYRVTFRVRTFAMTYGGKKYVITIGCRMEKLEEELREVFIGVGGGLAFSVIFLMVTSYFVAGLILKPIRIMNYQARDISEQHLDRRIPVSGGRDEFNALAHTLNQVFNRLQLAFAQQKRLIADASHELKTPLTLIRLAADELRSSRNEMQPLQQSEERLARMTDHVLRMERLVKNLLDLSSLELEKTTTGDLVDIASVLTSLIEDYRLLAEMRGIEIGSQLPQRLEVEGDADRLTRAFSNILDNAIKYNLDGGRIEVAGSLLDDGISITVSNTGAGVAAAEIPKVFDRFYRVEESRSLRYGGSGLGLAIVRRIVDLHGGKVEFKSKPEDWTRVTVNLPRNIRKSFT